MTGRLPGNFELEGWYSQPEISRPSNDFHFTSEGSAKFCGFNPPVSLVVQRSSLTLSRSIEYTSSGERAELMEKARSRLFSCQTSPPMTPAGILGRVFGLPDTRSSTCNLLKPFSLTV